MIHPFQVNVCCLRSHRNPPSFHSETRQIFIREVEFKCIMIPVFVIFPQVIRSGDAISVRSRDITVIKMLVVMVMVLRDDHGGDDAWREEARPKVLTFSSWWQWWGITAALRSS